MAKKNSLRRDILLIFIGTLCGLTTSLIINKINIQREDKLSRYKERISFVTEISDDLGKRINYTFMLYKRKRDKDSTLNYALTQFGNSLEQWNQKIYRYRSIMRKEFGEDIEKQFVREIYKPLINLGNEAKYKTCSDSFESRYLELTISTNRFVDNLFNDFQEN